MSHAPSLRQIREAIESHARSASVDEVALASLRQDVAQMRESLCVAIERTRDFASRGLVSEAASVIEDFPDLARQTEALLNFPRSSAAASRFWQEHVESADGSAWMPTSQDVDALVRIGEQASRLRILLDALRVASLRRESIGNRLAILKKLREADGQNRLWLDQIDALEREWLKRIGEMRTDPAVRREELEEAFTALSTRQWIASVPRGLKEEIYARVKPMRAEAAGDQYGELAIKIHDAAALMDRVELERLEAAWAQVYHETGRMPDESVQASVASAFEWLGRVVADERAQAEFEGQVDQLERMLDGRAPVADIERQVAVLRDSGRSAPDGLIARVQGYVTAERDRLRRRHRLVLIGSMATAAVLALAGVLAISAYARAKDRDTAAAALRALLEKGEVNEAHALANEIRAKPELLSPEVNALLAREEQALGAWNVERAAISQKVSDLQAELAKDLPRAQLKALLAEVNALSKRASLAEEKTAAEQLALLHAQREHARDEADAKSTDAGLAAVDGELRAWPLPDRWTPEQGVDLTRWDAYIVVLERAKGSVERLALDVAGSDIQESRLKTKGDSVSARLDEAKTRRTELATALAALAPAKFGASVSVETDFVERLQSLLKQHGATMRRTGQDVAFEKSVRFEPAWKSIQAWRDEVWPRIDLSRNTQVDPASEDSPVSRLKRFIADYPATPYRQRVEELIRRIDPASQSPLWSADRVRGVLADHFFANLEEVPFARGERFIYRRPSPTDSDPMHRAVENLADLVGNPDRLNAYLPSSGDQILGGSRPCDVSLAWAQTEQALSAADATEVQGLLLDLLERLRTMQQGEIFFRLHALRDLAVVFKQSGHVPPAAEKPLDDWLGRCGKLWANSLLVDWPLAAHSPPANVRALRTEAASAISEFPRLVQIAEAAKAERERARSELRPLSPIGVLLPSTEPGGARELGERRPDGPVVIVAEGSAGFRFLDAQLRGGRIESTKDIPAGPVLVFRRTGS